VALTGDRRDAYRALVGRSEGKRPIGRPKRRRENNIKMGIPEMAWEGIEWIDLDENRDRWCVILYVVVYIVT
jgi:hypothetical protein